MAYENDVLNPDPEGLDKNSGGFGLRLFKSNTDAMREDVAPRAYGSSPQPQGQRTIGDMMGLGFDSGTSSVGVGSAAAHKPAAKGGRSVADMMGMGASTFDEEETKPADQGNFSRGFAVSGKQLKQTAYGTAALIGDTIGATGVKEWGLKGYKQAEGEVQAISKESDSFTNAMQKGELGKWFTYSAGYLLGQVAELGAASLAGGAIGGSLAGPAAPAGAAAGAVAGAIEKGAVESGIKAAVAKMIDKEAASLVASGMAKEAAAETAMKSVYRTIGATTANTFLNATQELGSIYGDAVEEAAKTGKEYSLGKVWLSGVMATAVDSWADSKAVGKLMDAVKGGKGVGGIAVEAFKGGFREGMTEGVQTAIERWGADKDLTSQEAFKEYIDSAAVGVLGGTVSGGAAAGVKTMLEPGQPLPDKPENKDQTTGFNDTGVTNLPSSMNGREAVRPDELVMPEGQFRATLADVGYVASIYQDADIQQKKLIDMAIERANLRREFDAAFRDGDAMAAGQAVLTERPEERDLFLSALNKYATTMPRSGNFKTAPPKPITEQEQLDRISEANEQEYGPAAKPVEPVASTYAPDTALAPEVNAAGELLSNIDNGALTIDRGQLTSVAEGLGITVDAQDKPESIIGKIRDAFTLSSEKPADQAQEVSLEQQSEILGHLNDRQKAKGKPELADADVEMAQLPDGIQKLADLFGVKAVGFKSDKTTVRGFAGPNNQIYLNVAHSDKIDPRMVLGHEIWHQLERRDPALAKELSAEVVKYIKGEAFEKYASDLEQMGYSKDKINSEATADVLGIMFTDRAFWEQLGQKNPSLVQRVLGLINEILDAIKTAAKAERRGLNAEAITDLNQVRDMLTDVVAKLAETPDASTDTNIDLMDEADALESVKTLMRQGKFEAARKLFITEKLNARTGVNFNNVLKDMKTPAKTEVSEEEKPAPKVKKVEPFREERTSELKQSGSGTTQGAKAERTIDTPDEGQPGDFGVDADEIDYGNYRGEKIVKEKKQKAAPTPPKGQMSLGLKQDPAYIALKAKIDGILRMTSQAQFYRDTLARLYQGVAEIDNSLREGRTFEENGVRFTAVDESDENAYLWGEQGFRNAKNLPQEKLMAIRRNLMDEIAKVQVESVRGRAALFRASLKRVDYDLAIARAKAINSGMDINEVDSLYEPARQSIVAMRKAKREENAQTSTSVEDQAMQEAFQSDMFEGQKAAMGLIADFKANRLTSAQLVQLERQGLREGDFNHVELIAAYRAFGMDPTHDVLNVNTQLSVRKTMLDHLRDNNYSTFARNEWLTSMHKVVARYPGLMSDYFTEGERRLYDEWVQPRKALEKRLRVTEQMKSAQDPREAFSNLLFVKYGLEQMRNPDSIKDEITRNALKSTIPDLEQAWLQDLAYALRRRPSLANQIFDAEEGLVIPADKETFDKWIERQKAARDKDVALMIKAPYFLELRNIDGFAERIPGRPESEQPGPTTTSVPDLVPELRKAPSEWEQIYSKIANADIENLDNIKDMMSRLAALRSGKIDPETGDPITDGDADALAADTIDSVLMNSMMQPSYDQYGNERTQFGASYQPDIGFGMTAEQAAERDMGIPTNADLNIENELEAESGIYEVSEEGEITDETSQNEQAAEPQDFGEVMDEARQNKFKPRGIPQSLEGGDQYEFMDDYDFIDGPWKGAPSLASLADEIAKLDSPVPVQLLEHAGQLPEPLRSKVMARIGQNLGAKGLYHDGQVYVFGSQILGPTDLKFTVFHEVYGHLGLRAFLGEKFDKFLETAYSTSNEVKMLADAIMQEKGVGKLEAVDEVLAGMAAVDRPVSAFNQWLGQVIEGLRKMGFNSVADWFAQSSGAEIAFTLQRAKEAVRSGQMIMSGSPEEFRLSEQVLPYEMFAIAKGQTRAYVRFNPVTNTWAAFIANGNDIRDKAGYTSMVFDTYEEAYKAIETKGKIERRTRSGMYIDDKIPQDLVKLPTFKDVGAWQSFKNTFITRVQNEYHPVFQVVEHLRRMGRINEQIDVKQALMLYERRTGAAVEFFREHHVEPILKMVAEAGKQGADINVINRFLTARHAEERNRTVAHVNPSMKDGGSGLTTAEAKAILADVAKQPYAKVLEDLGARMDTISKEKLQYMLAHGMITKKAFEKMSKYKHYVNLSGVVGVDEEFDDPGLLAGGNKFNAQKGAEKRAFGRGAGNEAPDVLARTILSAEAQIIRANKNMVAQRILGMLEVNQDPGFAMINKQAFKRQVSPVTGQVEFVPDTNYMAQKNVMVAKVRGIPVTIEFTDNTAGSFADAIHGMVMPPQATPIMAKLGEVNQFMGQMLTTWNPAWIAVNFIRDIQTMYFNAATDGRITKAHARAMLKAVPQAIAVALHRYNPNLPFRPDPEMLRIYDEMKAEGGLTSFVNRHGLEDQVSQINAALYGKTRMQKVQGLLDFMEALTIPMEVAPRLAAYKVMVDAGFSRADAAVFSGEITINFNMRGSMKELRQLYLFFNPAVQGTAKMFDLAKNNPAKMTKYAFAFAGVGAMANLFARAMSGDDDDDINRLDKLPIYKRATSIVLWADGPAIPIPYGWNAFYATGHFMMDSLLGVQPLGVSAKRAAVSAFESFTPLGTAGLDSKDAVTAVAKGLAPTATLPIVEYIANENRYGAPIRQTQSPFDMAQKPDSESYFRSVSPISKAVTGTLKEMTGGSKYNDKGIDINPSVVDFVIASYLPGFANEVYKGASLAVRAARGETLKDAPLPLLGRFEARVPEGYDAGAFRRAATLVETTYKEFKMDPEARERIHEEFPSIGAAHSVISSTTQQIREIHKAMDNTERSQSYSDAEKVERQNTLREREKAAYERAVKRLSQLGGKYKEALIEAQ